MCHFMQELHWFDLLGIYCVNFMYNLYNKFKAYNKSTTNLTSGVWALTARPDIL